MTPEAMTRAERTRATVAHGGAVRLLRFLVASAVVHGLLAVALLRDASPKVVPASRPSVDAQAMVWVESLAGPPAAAAAVAPRSEAAPVRRAPVAAPAVARQAPPPAREVKPSLAGPPAPAAAPEVAPEVASEVAPLMPLASARAEAVATALAPQGSLGATAPESASAPAEAAVTATVPRGSLGATAPEGVPGQAAAPGGVGSQGAAAPGAGGAAGSTGAADLGAYARRLYQQVGRQRRYPASAARFGMEGTARVHLSVHRDGTLARAPRLERSSGHEVLDAEALRMVEAAAPFAPLPEGHTRPSAEFVIPVDFSLRPAG